MKYFVGTDQQIKNVKAWNKKYGWGFTAKDFKDLPAAPEWPEEELVAVVLVPYLKTVQKSFDSLCKVLEDEYENYWRWDEFKKAKLLDGIKAPVGLRWEVIDFGANRDFSPEDVRDQDSPHIGVLAAAAHFKDWVQAMDGDKVPYVWMPGLTAPDFRVWRRVPLLNWHRGDRRVRVDALWAGHRHSRYAVPVFRESRPSEAGDLAELGSMELSSSGSLKIKGEQYELSSYGPKHNDGSRAATLRLVEE